MPEIIIMGNFRGTIYTPDAAGRATTAGILADFRLAAVDSGSMAKLSDLSDSDLLSDLAESSLSELGVTGRVILNTGIG